MVIAGDFRLVLGHYDSEGDTFDYEKVLYPSESSSEDFPKSGEEPKKGGKRSGKK